MRAGRLGLRGKFIVSLLIAAALPFLVGLLFFEASGYRHLLAERGRLHHLDALNLVRALNQASDGQGRSLRAWLSADPVVPAVVAGRNQEAAGRPPGELAQETRQLDEAWPSLAADDPRLQAVVDNPASVSLRDYMGLFREVAEVLVTDAAGRLAAATGKSSDFDQADEDWWREGAALEPQGNKIDVLRFDASSGVFSLDVVMPLHAKEALAGVVKMSVDVTSLFAGLSLADNEAGERWEIALPDGRILASSKRGFVPLEGKLPDDVLAVLRRGNKDWILLTDADGEVRMAGFVGMGAAAEPPNAFVLFSSRRDDVVRPLHRSLLHIGLAATGLLAICALGGFLMIRRNVLRPLAALGRAARSVAAIQLRPAAGDDEQEARQRRELAQADLRHLEAIRTGDEVEELAGDFAVMTNRVLGYQRELEAEVDAKTAVIREDLEMAREFQMALLPSRYPAAPAAAGLNPLRLQFAHFYQPASTVGGDFFDLFELDDHRVGILIADVMGHGARSALVTAILRALVRNHAAVASEPGSFLAELNRHLGEVISCSGQTLFVTAFFLVLDSRHGRATWSMAGHPAPLRVRRGSGDVPRPLWVEPQRQPALGLVADATFHTDGSPLESGDVFLLFTDGLTEAENPAGEHFGLDRLAASFDQALDGPMAAMPAKIVCDVTAFQKRRHYDDDVCLVAVEAVSALGFG